MTLTPDISEPYEKACFVKQLQCLWSRLQSAPSRLYQQSLCSVTVITISINFGCCPKQRSRCSKQGIRAFTLLDKNEVLYVPLCLYDICFSRMLYFTLITLFVCLCLTNTHMFYPIHIVICSLWILHTVNGS